MTREEAQQLLNRLVPCKYPAITVTVAKTNSLAFIRDITKDALWKSGKVGFKELQQFIAVAKNQESYIDLLKVLKRWVIVEEK
jgi:hypothetical protein